MLKETLSRRSLIAGAAAAAAVTAIDGTFSASAQEAFDMAQATPTPLGPVMPPEITEFATDWPTPLGSLNGWRNNVGSAIDSSNVGSLGVQWTLPIANGCTGTPIIAGDTVYIQDMSSNIYALDRATGDVKWTAEYNIGTLGPNGCAIGYGMVYACLGDTCEVVAHDMATGDQVWRVKLSNNLVEGTLIAPTIYNNTCFVSTNPGNNVEGWYDGGGRGVFFALDVATGLPVWTWDTTTDNLWDHPSVNSGGGLWYPVTFDDEGNLYFGVGNPAPWPGTADYPNGTSRESDNLYTNSMVSLTPEGSLRWYVQAAPFDLFDLDFQLSPIITTIDDYGVDRLVAIGAGKTGTIITADAETGRKIWEIEVGIHQNDDREVVPEGVTIEVYPGALGGVETPMAYGDGRIFAAVMNLATFYTSTGISFGPASTWPVFGELYGINASNGAVEWHWNVPGMPLGAMAVANDVVFHVGTNGTVMGFDSTAGTLIWQYQLPSGVNAPVAIAGDEIYVAAAGGFTATPDLFEDGAVPEQAPGLYVFKLGVGGGTTPMTEPEPYTGPNHQAMNDDQAAQNAAATDETSTEIPADAATPEDGTLTFDAFDMGYTVSNISIPADTDITFVMNNTGAAVHNWIVSEGASIDSGDAEPGTTITWVVNLPAGVYTFYCDIVGHRAAGMEGTIYVS